MVGSMRCFSGGAATALIVCLKTARCLLPSQRSYNTSFFLRNASVSWSLGMLSWYAISFVSIARKTDEDHASTYYENPRLDATIVTWPITFDFHSTGDLQLIFFDTTGWNKCIDYLVPISCKGRNPPLHSPMRVLFPSENSTDYWSRGPESR